MQNSVFTEDSRCPEEPVRMNILKRQFALPGTGKQLAFDIILGVVAPLLCFFLDPGFFRPHAGNAIGLFTDFRLLVYSFSALAIVTLCLWLARGARNGVLNGVIAGGLAAGTLVSLGLGIIILPFVPVGLFIVGGLGLLGFVPLLTGFVYLRNCQRALWMATQDYETPLMAKAALTGFFLLFCLPALLNWQAIRIDEQIKNDLSSNNPQVAEAAIERTRYVGWMLDTDRWVWVYNNEKDEARKSRLKRAFFAATGEDIENRLAFLSD